MAAVLSLVPSISPAILLLLWMDDDKPFAYNNDGVANDGVAECEFGWCCCWGEDVCSDDDTDIDDDNDDDDEDALINLLMLLFIPFATECCGETDRIWLLLTLAIIAPLELFEDEELETAPTGAVEETGVHFGCKFDGNDVGGNIGKILGEPVADNRFVELCDRCDVFTFPFIANVPDSFEVWNKLVWSPAPVITFPVLFATWEVDEATVTDADGKADDKVDKCCA